MPYASAGSGGRGSPFYFNPGADIFWKKASATWQQILHKRADNATLTARRYVLVGVTRRQHRVGSRYPASAGPINCHGARRVWRVFLQSRCKSLLSITRVAVQVLLEPGTIPDYKAGWLHWRSVAAQIVSEAENGQGAGFILGADARVRVQEPLQICLKGRSKAKTVTSLLNIPSVLAFRARINLSMVTINFFVMC